MSSDRLDAVPVARRTALRGILGASALAAPVVTSVVLGGTPASAASPDISGATTAPPAATTAPPTSTSEPTTTPGATTATPTTTTTSEPTTTELPTTLPTEET